MNNLKLLDLAKQLGVVLHEHNLLLVTAESCTGGMVASAITSISGSADWFERGFVTYSNESKQELLGVGCETIEKQGAVSAETVNEMAVGALNNSRAQVSIAITGVAGPAGGTQEHPVGTIYFGFARQNKSTLVLKQHFQGERNNIRIQATEFALSKLIEFVS